MVQNRFGLRQLGLPFTTIPTPRKMLQVLFDVLEVLRYLYSECKVLHRDVSAGNVLYMEDSSASLQTAGAESPAAGQALPVFVKYLLRESKDRQQTSILLIDFNRAELLNGSDHQRMDRTGTPLFIARAVEDAKAVPPHEVALIPAVPQSPECYALTHLGRIAKFPFQKQRVICKPKSEVSSWRHDLDHDVESVFWLLLYWAMVIQPVKGPTEDINPSAWVQLVGDAMNRTDLVESIAQRRGGRPGLTHSTYKPLLPLIKNLASILVVDRQWLSESDVRNDPTYICEAFQRFILQFILDHHGQKEFMDCEAAIEFRSVNQTP